MKYFSPDTGKQENVFLFTFDEEKKTNCDAEKKVYVCLLRWGGKTELLEGLFIPSPKSPKSPSTKSPSPEKQRLKHNGNSFNLPRQGLSGLNPDSD